MSVTYQKGQTPREGNLLVIGFWGCAAGWGRIFMITNELDCNELTFSVLEWDRTFSGFRGVVGGGGKENSRG